MKDLFLGIPDQRIALKLRALLPPSIDRYRTGSSESEVSLRRHTQSLEVSLTTHAASLPVQVRILYGSSLVVIISSGVL